METKGFCSIDRLVLLVRCPRLSLYEHEVEECGKNEAFKLKEQRVLRFADAFFKMAGADLDPEFKTSETPLYRYHARFKDGLDVQFAPTYPVRRKVIDPKLLEKNGTKEDIERGFMYEASDSDYGLRLEFNPNKQDPITNSRCLRVLGDLLNADSHGEKLFRVSRIDIAVDYPVEVLAELIDSRSLRKSFTASGKGGLESVYFGSRSSKYFFRIYNKARELEEVQGIKHPGPLWRIELECKEPFPFDELPKGLSSAFERLDLYFGAVATDDPYLNCVLFTARHFGLKSVLDSFPRTTRCRIKRKLEGCTERAIEHPQQVLDREFLPVWEELKLRIRDAFGIK